MLRWSSSSPVRRLRRFFSAVGWPPGGRIGDVEVAPRKKSTLQPPTRVKRSSVRGNWCSFIGQITAPVTVYRAGAWYRDDAGVFTFLKVKGPRLNKDTFPIEICISMRGELAQVALRYLRNEQYVFVSGQLYSYSRINHLRYKVIVQELNFIRMNGQNEASHKSKEDLKNEEMALAASTANSSSCDVNDEDRTKKRHILWQIFFANPFEWWDNRATKTSRQPDFKHKMTGESLWIRSDDPPWVNEQLKLYDAKMFEINLFGKQDDHGLRGWKMQDFDHL